MEPAHCLGGLDNRGFCPKQVLRVWASFTSGNRSGAAFAITDRLLDLPALDASSCRAGAELASQSGNVASAEQSRLSIAQGSPIKPETVTHVPERLLPISPVRTGTCLVTRCPIAGSSSSINCHFKPIKGWALKIGKASLTISTTSGRRLSRLNGWVLRVFAVVRGNPPGMLVWYQRNGPDHKHPGPALDVVSPHRFTFCIDCFESGSEGRVFCCRINLAKNSGLLISGRAHPTNVPPRDDRKTRGTAFAASGIDDSGRR
jgi:hypothetical protein